MTRRRRANDNGAPKAVNRRFTRRRALAGLGASAALAPLLPIFERESNAADDTFPRRLVLLFTPNGTLHERWVPTGTETDFELGPLLAPLQPLQHKLVVVDGLRVIHNGPGDAHQRGMGGLWTGSTLLSTEDDAVGFAGGMSIDQCVADAVGDDTPYRSLEFGAQTGGATVWSRMSYAGPNSPVAPENDPRAMFDRLFADLGVSATELERTRSERRSVIDLVRADLRTLRGRSSGRDRIKLDAHLDAIRQIERRNELSGPPCGHPVQDPLAAASGNDNFPLVCDQMIDQVVTALACDLTRVASLQFSRALSDVRFTWEGIDERHHDLSHRADTDPTMVDGISKINEWYARRVAALLQKMDEIPEGDGTLLDNTLVVWGNELGRGNLHSNHPVPFVIAGGGGGRIQTGRFVQHDDVPHNRLLVSVANAMGVEVQTFGNNDPGSGGLPSVY